MSHSALNNRESILIVLYEYLKREYALVVSFWSQSRIKVECFVRIISVSTRCISHSGLNNRESSLSVLHE